MSSYPDPPDIAEQLLEDTVDSMNREWGISPKHEDFSSTANPDNKPPMLAKSFETIERNMRAIESGRHVPGQYPVLEKLIGGGRARRRARRQIPQVPPPQYPSRLITDVTPTIRERLAVVEHVAADFKEKFEEHRHESIRATERAEQMFATKMDLTSLQGRVDALASKSTWRTIAVVITTSGTVIAVVWYAVQLGSKLAHQL